jgi:predicted DNA-binding transcriptional regulator AlpA
MRKKPKTAIDTWDDSGLIRKRDVLTRFISVSRATFDRWVAGGYFPPGEVVGGRIRMWQVKQVKAWLNGNRRSIRGVRK